MKRPGLSVPALVILPTCFWESIVSVRSQRSQARTASRLSAGEAKRLLLERLAIVQFGPLFAAATAKIGRRVIALT